MTLLEFGVNMVQRFFYVKLKAFKVFCVWWGGAYEFQRISGMQFIKKFRYGFGFIFMF